MTERDTKSWEPYESDAADLEAAADREDGRRSVAPGHVWRHSSALGAARVLNARTATAQRRVRGTA